MISYVFSSYVLHSNNHALSECQIVWLVETSNCLGLNVLGTKNHPNSSGLRSSMRWGSPLTSLQMQIFNTIWGCLLETLSLLFANISWPQMTRLVLSYMVVVFSHYGISEVPLIKKTTVRGLDRIKDSLSHLYGCYTTWGWERWVSTWITITYKGIKVWPFESRSLENC